MLPTWKKKKKGKSLKRSLVDKLDRIFSKYIRLRDAMPSGMCRCISCGKIKPVGDIDAGHYFSRTHMGTRFDPFNVHGECRYCNRMSADHLINYRENLIRKIGLANYNYLEIKARTPKKWDDFELQQLIDYYKKEVERLSATKGIKI